MSCLVTMHLENRVAFANRSFDEGKLCTPRAQHRTPSYQTHNPRSSILERNLMNCFRILILAALATAMVAYGQPNITVDSPFQVRYASNLNIGDSVVNITNSGARGAGLASGTSASTTGAICANVYTFSPDEQLIACCSCPVTPNGLVSLSARNDLISNTLTPAVPTAVVIKLLASIPVSGSCASSAFAPGALTSGMLAWGTTLHALPTSPVTFALTETPF